MKVASANTICMNLLPQLALSKFHPSCKWAHHRRLLGLSFNQFHTEKFLSSKLELVSKSVKGFDSQYRKFTGLSVMGELGQEHVSLGMMEMGSVLPATEFHVEKAAKALEAGQVIAVPTDTLYGLACDACSPAAVQRIYEIKGRSMTSPLAVCVADVLDVNRFAVASHLPDGLLSSLLPGPVTLVLDRGKESMLEKSLNPGVNTIGIRIPECDFIRMVARNFGSALALTSANQSGQPSTVCIQEFEHLWQHCAYIYDGGQLPVGRAGSTIIDLTTPKVYKILRRGSASKETREILDIFGFKEIN
jgi:tRNA threonylcarbamoyl adenosine modification protein (Sua5/YciO/YrdC/YwlC family)